MATWARKACGFDSKSASDASSTVTVSGKSSRSASLAPEQFVANADYPAWCSPCKDALQSKLPSQIGSYSRCQSPDDYYFDPKDDMFFEPSPMNSQCVRGSGTPLALMPHELPGFPIWPDEEVSEKSPSPNYFDSAEKSQAGNIVDSAETPAVRLIQGKAWSGEDRPRRWARGSRSGAKHRAVAKERASRAKFQELSMGSSNLNKPKEAVDKMIVALYDHLELSPCLR